MQTYKIQSKPLVSFFLLPSSLSKILLNKYSMPARCISVPQIYLGHWDPGLLVISSLLSHQLYPIHILLFFRDMKDISPQNNYT